MKPFLAMAQPNMYGRRFGRVHRAAHETLNPSPEMHVFALHGLYVLFANGVLRRNTTALVGRMVKIFTRLHARST